MSKCEMTAQSAGKSSKNVLLRTQAGFSLVELLATIVIMTLVGLVVTVGLPSAITSYRDAVDHFNAQTLLSTTVERLGDELSMVDPAKAVTVGTDEITYTNVETGLNVHIYNDSISKNLCMDEVYPGDPFPTSGGTPLVPPAMNKGVFESGAFARPLHNKIISISAPVNGVIEVTVKVFLGDSTVTNKSATVSIRLLAT